MYDMEVEMFGGALDNDELASELDALVANDVAKELGELEQLPVIVPKKNDPATQLEEEEEEPVAVKSKKKLVAA